MLGLVEDEERTGVARQLVDDAGASCQCRHRAYQDIGRRVEHSGIVPARVHSHGDLFPLVGKPDRPVELTGGLSQQLIAGGQPDNPASGVDDVRHQP